jgi:hypothetical protein
VKLRKFQVGSDKEEQQFNLNETANKKNETTLCKTEGLQRQWLSSQHQSAMQFELSFYERLERLSMSEGKHISDWLKPFP